MWFKLNLLPVSMVMLFAMSVLQIHALPADFFTEKSKLAEGNWIKISVSENGVYEITYDELREMGFDNPEKVGIFGRGGEEQPIQFLDSSSELLYTDDLQPVAVMHENDKIYFYGQGPVRIRYKYELSNPANQRFVRHNINTYSEYGYYFLTQDRDDILMIEDAAGEFISDNEAVTECWDYFYHEIELDNVAKSGQVFLGENFVDDTLRNQIIHYSIPGAIPGSSGSIECRFAACNGFGSKLEYGFPDGLTVANIKSCMDLISYEFADPSKVEVMVPGPEGDILLNYMPSGQVKTANLDYLIVGAKKEIAFVNEESQFRAFIPNYKVSTHGYISIRNATESTYAWDVTNSNIVNNLPIDYSEGTANAKYFTASKKDGMMMVFDTSRPQKRISGYEKVENQNIHGCETPNLLIITTPLFYEKAEELADIHRQYDGIDVLVLTSEQVINEFSAGTPDAMAYRGLCKMFYDRNPEKFKNILLFGEYHYDNRKIKLTKDDNKLISYQTPESRIYDQSLNIGDYYGMMTDYYPAYASGSNLYNRDIQIGVGHLPCRSIHEANILINKIVQYLLDDSYAYWVGNMQFLGDGWDNNEHQNHCENLAERINSLSDRNVLVSKVYLNAYPKGNDRDKMLQNFNTGMLVSTYFGHANPQGLTMPLTLWNCQDAHLLNNSRLSFMNFAACTVTASDNGQKGSSEFLLFAEDVGIIGGIMANRSAYSNQNNYFMAAFNEACLLEDPKKSKTDYLSSRKTIGEIYATTKTNLATSMNEYAFQLVCDPAIVIPFPTCEVSVESVAVEDEVVTDFSELNPGAAVKIKGMIKNREGEDLTDFNGYLVVKVCDAPVVKKTLGLYSSAVDVKYDENVLATYELKVEAGSFDGTIVLPRTLRTTVGKEYATLRLSAYDANQRKSAIGKFNFSVGEYDSSKVAVDESQPKIEEFYLNSSDFEEGNIVGRDFIVYATITDDLALKLGTCDAISNLLLTLDDRFVYSNVESHAEINNEGKIIKVAFPMANVDYGYHSLTLIATDLMDNKISQTISFQVYEGSIGGELHSDLVPARTSTMLKLICDNTDIEHTAALYIVDASGNTIFTDLISGNEYEWDLRNSEGIRVLPGVYNAYVKLSAGGMIRGVTSPIEIVVLGEK